MGMNYEIHDCDAADFIGNAQYENGLLLFDSVVIQGEAIRFHSRVRRLLAGSFIGVVDIVPEMDTIGGWTMVLTFQRKVFDVEVSK